MVILGMSSLVIGILANQFHSKGIRWRILLLSLPGASNQVGWTTISVDSAFFLFLQQEAVFIDTRHREDFEFAEAVDNYCVVGEDLSRWVAVWLPYLEAITGVLLIVGIWLDATVTMNVLLMLIFLVLVSQAYGRGLDIRCGCYFVEDESIIGLMKVFENSLFMGCSILLAWLTWKEKQKPHKSG